MTGKQLYERYLQSGKVSTDTRQITPGSVFFALKGPKFNANEFASEALEKGASYAVIDDKNFIQFRATKNNLIQLRIIFYSIQVMNISAKVFRRNR